MNILNGIVSNNKMDKTLTVKIEKKIKDKKYKKYIKTHTKYFIHDENNKCKIGDHIVFCEGRHISKKKKWMLMSITNGDNL